MFRGVTVGAVAGRDYLFNPIMSSFLDGITMTIKFPINIVFKDLFLIICYFLISIESFISLVLYGIPRLPSTTYHEPYLRNCLTSLPRSDRKTLNNTNESFSIFRKFTDRQDEHIARYLSHSHRHISFLQLRGLAVMP